ncbi:hypothetical protein [Sphingobacterium sp. BIGb0165]|uniref:hypothetical protein n=1 Tax=Sphingobacterium sp. BIGb0165 TaxID=2940615 RepID=UPI002168279F|nr:hypothetical protein [Sphingobacterium sp. BIGb0165]MCS4226470.1 hypothetical protein [Sphingobacterium sp. BIGb0165]
MKKYLLLVLVMLVNTIAMAQNTAPEKHLHKAFEAIKNRDAKAFKTLWPDQQTFSEISISTGDFDARTSDLVEVYNESRYYKMMGKILEDFCEVKNGEINWQDLYIQEIKSDNNKAKNSEGIIEYSGFIWVKSNRDKAENYVLRYVDLIQFKEQWYGGLFRDLKAFDGNFEDFVIAEEPGDPIAAEAATVATEAVEASADSAAALVELPLLEQTTFSTTINGRKMILNWKVNGWKEDPVYDQTTYQYQNKEEQSFAEIVALENGYLLFIEQDRKNFFRIKNTYGSLSGFWFSTQVGKEIPVTFASTEAKK